MDIGKLPLPIPNVLDLNEPDLAGILLDATRVLDSDHRISAGIARIKASAPIAIGNAVCVFNGLAEPASAATGRVAIGVCIRSAAVAGQVATIILGMGYASGLAGLTPNTSYYLGNAGAIVAGIPGAGMKQSIGYALSATELFVTISQPFA